MAEEIKNSTNHGEKTSASTKTFILSMEAAGNKRRKHVGRRNQGTGNKLNINSLMDILTIILVFLLKSYSSNPVNVTPGDDLKLPTSNSILPPEEAVPIAITKRAILVNDEPIVEVQNGKVPASEKRDGVQGYFITPLYDALADESEKQKNIAKYNDAQEFKGVALIIGDEKVPYRLLSEVLYTSGQAQFGNYKFVVIKKE